MTSQDEKYMQAALKLAVKGTGSVEPNPLAGCVIVKGGQIIGRGWHKNFGGPHAEINALQDCKSIGSSPQGAVMYVTLEPCCHQGKTGPCTDTIIAAKPARVVAAMIDPSSHADGKGIEQLRQAGIEVQVGLCEGEARLLNAPFIKFASTGKSWVILKWAQSIDGKLAWADNTTGQRWISSEQSRKDAHKLRLRVQGILVGINTVLADNPLLTPRPGKDKKPLRIVLDSKLRMPLNCKLLKTAKKIPVLVAASYEASQANQQKVEQITHEGAEILAVPTINDRCDMEVLLDELSRRGVAQLLVEGGPTVISSFLKQGLADEIRVYIAPMILGEKGKAGMTELMANLSQEVNLHYVDVKRFGNDACLSGLLKKVTTKGSL